MSICPNCKKVSGFHYTFTSSRGTFCDEKCHDEYVERTRGKRMEKTPDNILNEVIGKTCWNVVVTDEEILWTTHESNITGGIGIYEFIRLCKEWAWTRDFSIETDFTRTTGKARLRWNEEMGFCRLGFQRQHTYYSDWIRGDSELDATVKAVELILKTKDKE